MSDVRVVLQQERIDRVEVFDWKGIVESVAVAFQFTTDEKQRFASKDLAKLIAAIPYLAGSKDPHRTSLSHLGTYVLSVKLKGEAKARPSDTEYFMRRIELLGNFLDGDEEIITRGMNLIALCMLSNYVHDVENDNEEGKYNPVATGEIDANAIRADLVRAIEAVPCSDMDRIMMPATAWNWSRFWIY